MIAEAEIKPIRSGRGGRRVGAGRPRGPRSELIRSIESRAQEYASIALDALIAVAGEGRSESARVAAAQALLDRGYGKPRQALEHSGSISDMPQIIVE